MAPHRPAISPSSSLASNGKFGESSHCLKTSTELLKVLNRIWSLEEKHALDMSLVKTLRRELDQSQARIQELMQERKRDQNEINNLMKQITEYKVTRKKEQERIRDAVKLVEEKLEDELKLRRHSEKRHHKLAKELSEMKSSFSNALRELERERKARTLLEDLSDEFAKGIRDYEQEVRFLKHKSCKDQIGGEGNDRLILHISEAWLDERAQMKLAGAHDISEKQSALDKLCLEIEAFLQEKQSGNSGKNDYMSSKSPRESNILPRSLESFHLNEPASAPWNGNDEDDSVGVSNHCPQFCRGFSSKQANDFSRQQGEITSEGHNKETTKPKPVNKKVQSRKASDPSCSQMQLEERKHQLVNEGSTKSRTENVNEANNPRMPKKGEMMQRSSREGKNRITDADVDSQDATTRYLSTSEDKKLKHENNCMEGSFDPSTFAGPPSPVKKWTSEVSAAVPDISESSSRWPKSVKPNTLKAKLMEARLQGQQSRTRTSKGSSQVD